MADMPPACMTCRHHYSEQFSAELGRSDMCRRAPLTGEWDPVAGRDVVYLNHWRESKCRIVRRDAGRCGPDGRWYEPARADFRPWWRLGWL